MSARVCLPPMFILAAMCAPPAFALEPAELILIVNKNEPASGELAAYYARVRGVPAENIIPLDLPLLIRIRCPTHHKAASTDKGAARHRTRLPTKHFPLNCMCVSQTILPDVHFSDDRFVCFYFAHSLFMFLIFSFATPPKECTRNATACTNRTFCVSTCGDKTKRIRF